MSTHEKLKARIRRRPTDFTFKEIKTLLQGLGYTEESGGHSGGSRVTFYNRKLNQVIKLHKPHPKNVLKQYQIKQVIETLTIQKLI